MTRADDLPAPSATSADDVASPAEKSRTGAPAIARVALDTPLLTLFDYRLDQAASPGQLVQVPFGRRQVVGIVWELTQRSEVDPGKLREVTAVWHELPALGDEWRALMQFASRYYQRGIGEVALPAVPGHLRTPMRWPRLLARRGVQRYRIADGALGALMENVPARLRAQRRLAQGLAQAGTLDADEARALCAKAADVLKQWAAAGWVAVETVPLHEAMHETRDEIDSRIDHEARDAADDETPASHTAKTLTAGQAHAVAAIHDALVAAGARRLGSIASNPPQSTASAPPPPSSPSGVCADSASTTAEPAACPPFLLYGVTGSGKTEVYLRAVAEALRERDAQVLVLVPEINLTPQLEGVFRSRFPGETLVTLHSGLAEGERARHWLAAHRGEARVVLGTRLAVMASLPHLRLIVVDEEHDPSYKQQEGLRYSARDLAIWRANRLRIPVVLGSATPSLDSWRRAEQGRYVRLSMPERATPDAVLPRVSLIDMEIERKRQRVVHEGLSQALLAAVRARLEAGEQSLLFLNRRGYAPVLNCDACGWVSDCRRCSAHMVLHKPERRLRCHHCGAESRIPHACPDCGNLDLAPLGRGTQRIEETLAEHFPHARLARIDADSTRRKGSAQALFAQVHAGEVDILIGTQMVAKGHDFRNVTLVGVVNADSALFSHDFRAAERLFAQLMQVAGRAGRAARADGPGDVLIQTRYASHPLFASLMRHDYAGFAAQQLEERRVALLPPFTHQALLRAQARKLDDAMAFLRQARDIAADPSLHDPRISLWDPVPMTMVRIAGTERAQLVVESPHRGALQRFLSHWMGELRALKTPVHWHLEVDPLEI
ncbi:primosomal protein N' [Pandoraea nosoerga]|uniref:primosomal protein N' n=1 Tax=Pandoraea nosoerga TaxID=2508296 RepID=UPI00123FC079|nr:primosomal protein N' [Pandoraea nosoerga]MBN4664755.1 primosomal protein N' [Pandoraea nosoerga]MBN4674071.1 primosomal protein N' [Pandoraea nosoerga]MBN4679995.1 primosomal protein N' [Pandoraea nosoerga]MBN4744290.1 primosomal protein N' [Pandoraea nosoerga]